MADDRREILDRLLERHGRTFAAEVGVRLDHGRPAELYQLLVTAHLMSARISAGIAASAARALFARGYTTPERMLAASWQDRVDGLGEGHYVRYDESTATSLGETAELVQERYGGDLRRLRAAADGDPDRIGDLLREFKGIGRVGADIFRREAQAVWPELRPFADRVAMEAAQRLGLGSSSAELAQAAGRDDLSVVTAALVRARLGKELDALRTGETTGLTDTQLAILPRRRLYELARQHDVPRRSSMTRDQLADALRG